jgi:nitroimidazol reductase NimA-like FMN-containing flavoprotein (pyridoxamine 5'-phosphate oxidase superfamily)
MAKRRAEITMTEKEQRAFLEEAVAAGRTVTFASVDPNGYPHLVAMWTVLKDGLLHFTGYRKSQKILNLRRDPKITCMIEMGDTYEQVRGLVIQGRAEIVEDPELSKELMMVIGGTKDPDHPMGRESDEKIMTVARKRSSVRVHPERVYSWDHRKLGGSY